jgi:uncharacterized membrane protein YkvA (DUF1232 family)
MGATVGTDAASGPAAGMARGPAPRSGPRTRTRAERERKGGGLFGTIKQLPHYARLVFGLLTDARVSVLDKALVGAAVAYVLSPINLIPDFIPVIGELDDLFVLVLATQHLVANADPEIVLEHWGGDLDELDSLDVRRALLTAALFFPKALRRKLRLIGRFD